MPASELCFLPAAELAELIRSRHVSAVELMQAHIAQIERVNPQVNAVVTPMYLVTGYAILFSLQQLEKRFVIRR